MDRNNNLIYFNNNQTTALDEAVREIMLPFPDGGEEAKENNAEKAKEQLAELLNAKPGELLFTRGTSESINLALKAAYKLYEHKGNHIITNVSEHFATLNCCKDLESMGAAITHLPVNKEGLIDTEELKASIKPETIAVSIMAANNETGVIQPIEAIAEICQEKDVFFFSDASQFAGKMRCDVKDLGFSSIAFGAHKMYGPEGIGLLYLHEKHSDLMQHIKKSYRNDFTAAQFAGFGKAAEISAANYWENSAHISRLKNYFEHQLLDLEGLQINGSTRHRLYTTSNITFGSNEKIIPLLEKFNFAHNLEKPSYVLKAMGLSEDEIKRSFRFSFGKNNTLDEVKLLVEELLK